MDRSGLFLARRYAQAFLGAYYNILNSDHIAAFESAENFFKTHQPACFFLDLSLLSFESKRTAVLDLIEKFKLPDCSYALIMLIVKQRRALLLANVFHQLADLYKKQAGIVTFFIQSSQALDDQERKTIEFFLKEQVKGQIFCSYELNPDLIAGVRIFNEQYLWEYSAQAQLRVLYNSVRR